MPPKQKLYFEKNKNQKKAVEVLLKSRAQRAKHLEVPFEISPDAENLRRKIREKGIVFQQHKAVQDAAAKVVADTKQARKNAVDDVILGLPLSHQQHLAALNAVAPEIARNILHVAVQAQQPTVRFASPMKQHVPIKTKRKSTGANINNALIYKIKFEEGITDAATAGELYKLETGRKRLPNGFNTRFDSATRNPSGQYTPTHTAATSPVGSGLMVTVGKSKRPGLAGKLKKRKPYEDLVTGGGLIDDIKGAVSNIVKHNPLTALNTVLKTATTVLKKQGAKQIPVGGGFFGDLFDKVKSIGSKALSHVVGKITDDPMAALSKASELVGSAKGKYNDWKHPGSKSGVFSDLKGGNFIQDQLSKTGPIGNMIAHPIDLLGQVAGAMTKFHQLGQKFRDMYADATGQHKTAGGYLLIPKSHLKKIHAHVKALHGGSFADTFLKALMTPFSVVSKIVSNIPVVGKLLGPTVGTAANLVPNLIQGITGLTPYV